MRKAMAPLAAGLLLTACLGPPAELDADGGWIRLAAVKRQPAAAYVTIHGGASDDTLISVSCDVAIRSEMHGSMRAGAGTGVADMRPLGSVPIPARTTVTFQPGGRHVMLFDLNPGITPTGSYVPRLTLTFASGRRLVAKATVVGAGDPAPAA